MGFRFRKSIKIAPGVKLNFGKRGMSVSGGVKGLRVNVGRSGTKVTSSIPGTGISYEQRIGNKKSSTNQKPQVFEVNAFQIKDNKLNAFGRRMWKPLSYVLMGSVVLFLLFAAFPFAIIFGYFAYFFNKNAGVIPDGVICPCCNKRKVILEGTTEVQCSQCGSVLIVK